jgi:hypothetical protein
MKTVNKSFSNAGKFKYLRTTLTNQNCMHEEITSRFNSGNAGFCFDQCCLKASIKTIILSVVLYGCETWPPILRDEHGLRGFENSVMRKICKPTRQELT